MKKQKDVPFQALVHSNEKENCEQGLGVLDASGVEAGGRIVSVTETSEKIEILFAYYATKNQNGLSLKIGEPVSFDKQDTLKVHRVNITCLVIEENENSSLVLFPDPKKLTEQVRKQKE